MATRLGPPAANGAVSYGAATLAGLALIAAASVAASQVMRPADLAAAAKSGGLVINVRHASTERDYADQIGAVMGDCGTQRTLSEAGWAEARAIGAAFARLDLPVGDVVSSECCRARQTPDLAFGRYRETAALSFEKSEDFTEKPIARMRAAVSPLLEQTPDDAANIVIVGHDDPFEAATSKYPKPMGDAHFLRPDGAEGFDVLGAIASQKWNAVR
ncbi:MAG: histidine phosphatase family protein [Rubrimonas sp.]|uniref:histidine phosphatase family protein n=1 Tax=Rubrimonas sp. TaxID=2036015 RepID=UPI002FDE98CC